MDALRRHRRWLPTWLVAVFLFAQLVTAAYACPQAAGSVDPVVEMPDCHGTSAAAMDPAQPQLCKAHCEAGQQSINSNAGAASVPAPALLDSRWARAWVAVETTEPARPLVRSQALGPPTGTPPLYLSLLVLRN